MSQLDKILYLRTALKNKAPKQTEWDTYLSLYAKAFKKLQDSKITSLKESLEKVNEKLKT